MPFKHAYDYNVFMFMLNYLTKIFLPVFMPK